MILLDTDHVSVLRMPASARRDRLVGRMALAAEPIGIPVVATEETMRGWLSAIAKERRADRQVYAYRELGDMFAFFARFPITPFDDPAADRFGQLVAAKVRIGAMDLKIAAITLVHNALLLTANTQDFRQVPGLRFENWLDG
ncbi:MAG: type II toxin-antitoxin system VapC family toxin [Gemmataceae bacterium]|nr:type II toxin-antitoxin system VapC family toxin [Gemmataceae bacterium]